jgi:hypothetical protein
MNDAELYSNLVAQKRKRSQLKQQLLRSEEAPVDPATTERLWYLLYSLGLKEVLERFPKNVDLKITNAFVQKNKLNNEFKAPEVLRDGKAHCDRYRGSSLEL